MAPPFPTEDLWKELQRDHAFWESLLREDGFWAETADLSDEDAFEHFWRRMERFGFTGEPQAVVDARVRLLAPLRYAVTEFGIDAVRERLKRRIQ